MSTSSDRDASDGRRGALVSLIHKNPKGIIIKEELTAERRFKWTLSIAEGEARD